MTATGEMLKSRSGLRNESQTPQVTIPGSSIHGANTSYEPKPNPANLNLH